MKLLQAEKIASELIARIDRDRRNVTTLTLSAEEQVAIKVLWRFARRLVQAKASVRSLLLAIVGKDELNQEDLFGDSDT